MMDEKKLKEEIEKRRTFAIISHPDAGKTTITEQLLLFGGVVRQAGTVKGKKTGNFAKSDWMEIEKKRGISVTSSVMQFEYQGKRINILVSMFAACSLVAASVTKTACVVSSVNMVRLASRQFQQRQIAPL